MHDHIIAALIEEGLCRLCRSFKRRQDFFFFCLPVYIERFILKDKKKAAGDCLPGA